MRPGLRKCRGLASHFLPNSAGFHPWPPFLFGRNRTEPLTHNDFFSESWSNLVKEKLYTTEKNIHSLPVKELSNSATIYLYHACCSICMWMNINILSYKKKSYILFPANSLIIQNISRRQLCTYRLPVNGILWLAS